MTPDFLKKLTADEQQVLKDTLGYGFWGCGSMEFLNENGETETVGAYGYCTNAAIAGGGISKKMNLPPCSNQSTRNYFQTILSVGIFRYIRTGR